MECCFLLSWKNNPKIWMCYCWWKKSCTSWYGNHPIICRYLYIPGGAGFLPSTVWNALKKILYWKGATDNRWAHLQVNYLSFPVVYTRKLTAGIWKYFLEKGKTSTNQQFLGSMLVFGLYYIYMYILMHVYICIYPSLPKSSKYLVSR